ncbi:MAG: hypothetical protein J0I41_08590 [Filimonas sp.]|nr:hypothetical protein [Filimonas sp.]
MQKLLILFIAAIAAGVTLNLACQLWVAGSSALKQSHPGNPLIDDVAVEFCFLIIPHIMYWLTYYLLLTKAPLVLQIIFAIILGACFELIFMQLTYGIDLNYVPNKIQLICIAIFTGVAPLLYRVMNRTPQTT